LGDYGGINAPPPTCGCLVEEHVSMNPHNAKSKHVNLNSDKMKLVKKSYGLFIRPKNCVVHANVFNKEVSLPLRSILDIKFCMDL
jgi:threonyl-tRNA synthetase